jgi:hypothetical protein
MRNKGEKLPNMRLQRTRQRRAPLRLGVGRGNPSTAIRGARRKKAGPPSESTGQPATDTLLAKPQSNAKAPPSAAKQPPRLRQGQTPPAGLASHGQARHNAEAPPATASRRGPRQPAQVRAPARSRRPTSSMRSGWCAC